MSTTRSYRVLEVLGRGGFGTVYLARMEAQGFRKLVAIKLLKEDIVETGVLGRFRDEARILGLLHDRAILQVDPPIQLDGRWAVVMEYVDGASLARILRRRGPLPPRAALEAVAEVARALDKAAHRPGVDGKPLGLIHRDLKPSNLQLTHSGEVKILDFGNARARFEHREAATTTGVVGTPNYIAPERFAGVEEPKGDIFSLGVVLYRMLRGDLPGDEATELVDPLLKEAVGLSVRMRREDPRRRPSAREVEREVHGILEGATGPRLREWCEQHVPHRSQLQADELVGRVLVPGAREERSEGAEESTVIFRRIPVPSPTEPVAPRPSWWPSTIGLLAVVLVLCAGVGVRWSPDEERPVVRALPRPPEPEPIPTSLAPQPEPEPEPEVPPRPPPRPASSPAPIPVAPTPTPSPSPSPTTTTVTTTSNRPRFSVAFRSLPYQLDVFVDDHRVGIAPTRVDLAEGEHTVRIGTHEHTFTVGRFEPVGWTLDTRQERSWSPQF